MAKQVSLAVAVTALIVLSLSGGITRGDGLTPATTEPPEVTRLLESYVAKAAAGDIPGLTALYVAAMVEETPLEVIQEELGKEVETIRAMGELTAVTYLDREATNGGTKYFYKLGFAEANCNFTFEVNAELELNFLTFGKLPVNDFDSPRLERLSQELEGGDRSALDRFWKEIEGHAPLIEEIPGHDDLVWATFLWRAPNDATERVTMFGGLDVGDEKPLRRLADTALWYWTDALPRDSRFTYGFAINPPTTTPLSDTEDFLSAMIFRTDSRNPKQFNDSALVELPDAPPQPWAENKPAVASGTLTEHSIRSEILDEERRIVIYTPPDYNDKSKPSNMLIVFDGSVYGGSEDSTLVPTPVILDNLIHAGQIEPTIAVLVANTDRNRDLPCSPDFANFLATELVPWLQDNYRVTRKASRTIVAGSSFGGLAASCAALWHPKVFGNVLSQSGSYWFMPDWQSRRMIRGFPNETGWVMQQYKASRRLPVQFYLEVGRFEGSSMLATNRHFRDVLQSRGYEVTYSEFNGGHDYACWRGSLADGLIALVGTP